MDIYCENPTEVDLICYVLQFSTYFVTGSVVHKVIDFEL